MSFGMDRGLVRTERGYMHYYASGTGVPLVLCHLSARSGRMYIDVARRLSDVARTYAVDLPNYGCSDPVVGPLTMDVFTDALVALIEDQSLGRVVVGGAAMGSYISVALADRRPDMVRGVVLQSCPYYTDGADAVARHVRARAPYRTDETGFPQLRTLAEVRADDMVHAPTTPDELWLEQVNKDLAAAGRRFWDGMPVVADYDVRVGLSRIAVPVLMIWGRDFLYARRRQAIVDSVKDGRVRLIEGSGLHPEIDNAAQYDNALREFLEEVG